MEGTWIPQINLKDDSLLRTGGNIFSYPARVVVMILLFLDFAQTIYSINGEEAKQVSVPFYTSLGDDDIAGGRRVHPWVRSYQSSQRRDTFECSIVRL